MTVKNPKNRSNPIKAPRRALSKKRLWAFRFLAVLLPLFLILLLELGLRIGNYGYPANFFVRQRIGNEDFYVPNDRFGYRFFPETIRPCVFDGCGYLGRVLASPTDVAELNLQLFASGRGA